MGRSAPSAFGFGAPVDTVSGRQRQAERRDAVPFGRTQSKPLLNNAHQPLRLRPDKKHRDCAQSDECQRQAERPEGITMWQRCRAFRQNAVEAPPYQRSHLNSSSTSLVAVAPHCAQSDECQRQAERRDAVPFGRTQSKPSLSTLISLFDFVPIKNIGTALRVTNANVRLRSE